MLERKWDAVPPVAFTTTGTAFGQITVTDTAGFRVKQTVGITATPGQIVPAQVKRVISKTVVILGQVDGKVFQWGILNLSTFGPLNSAMVGAEQQDKAPIPPDPHYLAVYEGDPVDADRIIPVDKYGNYYDNNNPLPVAFDGTVSIGNVSIVEGGNTVKVNNDGSINVIVESIPSPNSQVVSTFAEATLVPSNSTVIIVTYTVPALKQAVLQRVPVSGENIGKYDLLINSIRQDTLRTMFGGDLTQMFDFTSGNDSGLLLSAGDVIQIQVFNPRPFSANYNARIQVLEITL